MPDRKFRGATETFIRIASGLAFLMAFLIIIPLTLHLAWGNTSALAYTIVMTLFCLSFGWGNLSMLLMHRGTRKLGLRPSSSSLMSIISSPRPDDPDELYVWRWTRQFLFAFIAIFLCMVALPITSWLSGR